MITLQPVTDQHVERFLALIWEDAKAYLVPTLTLMGITEGQFARTVHEVGQVFVIDQDGQTAGFCWIELRDKTLHLHGLVLDRAFQGRGIGSRVLQLLEDTNVGRAEVAELGVHHTASAGGGNIRPPPDTRPALAALQMVSKL